MGSEHSTDLHAYVTCQLPVAVLLDTLGFDHGHTKRVHALLMRITFNASPSDTQLAINELHNWTRGQLELGQGSAEVRALTVESTPPEEVCDALTNLLVAGTVAVTEAIDSGVRTLFEFMGTHAVSARQVRTSLPLVAAECLRLPTPDLTALRACASGIPRYANATMRVQDAVIVSGDLVLINNLLANLDPARFEAPHIFDPLRSSAKHLAFGSGPHACVGSLLATIELEELLDGLLEFMEDSPIVIQPFDLEHPSLSSCGHRSVLLRTEE